MVAVSTFSPFKLRLHQLVLMQGDLFTLGPLSFTLTSGSIVQIQGPNGIGKTTFLRTVAGFFMASSGQLDWISLPTQRPFCVFIANPLGLFSKITVKEQLRYWQKLHQATPQMAQTCIQVFHLDTLLDQPVCFLSQGEQQRLGLARLILSSCPVWLLDEPLTFLDEALRRVVLTVMCQHKDRGGLILFSTQYDQTLPGLLSLLLPEGMLV